MNQLKPVILLASERSGTNLLRALLDTHPEIASPPPSGMVDTLPDIAHRYLLPWHSPHIEELIGDVITLTKTHMDPWDGELDVEMVLDGLEDRSFWGVFRRVNEIYAAQHGAKCWFSKEPGLFRHAYAIHRHIPDAKFLYLVRDGRDVASSMLDYGLHESHIYPAARRWSMEQKYCLSAVSDPRLVSSTLMLKYEDLVAAPESELGRVMQFIGLDMDAGQLNFHRDRKTREHAGRSVFWSNLSRPISTASKGKFLESLSKRQVEIFESVAWVEMLSIGYRLHNSERKALSRKAILGFRLSQFLKERITRPVGDEREIQLRRVRDREVRKIVRRSEGFR